MIKPLLITALTLLSTAAFADAHGDHHDHAAHAHDTHSNDAHDNHAHKNDTHDKKDAHSADTRPHSTAAHGAHLHGVAELTVAIEGQALEIALTSPAMDIAGFEHRAQSEAEIAAVKKAGAALQKPQQLFLLKGKRCELEQHAVDMTAILTEQHTEHNHTDHDRSDHHHSDHGHTPRAQQHHSEVSANYRYKCQKEGKLMGIEIKLAEQFPSLEKLRVQWLKESEQGATTLSARTHLLQF